MAEGQRGKRTVDRGRGTGLPAGILNPGSENLTTTSDVARWRWGFFNFGDSAPATLTRTDTRACARLVITAEESSTYAGTYEGSVDLFTFEGQWWRPIVEFTLTVGEDLQAIGEGGVTATQVPTGGSRCIDLTFRCEGTVDDAGALICAGSGSWDVLITYSDGTTSGGSGSGPISLDLTAGADGSLTGSATDDWGTEARPIQGNAISGGPAGLP